MVSSYYHYISTCKELIQRNTLNYIYEKKCKKAFENKNLSSEEALLFFKENFYINYENNYKNEGLMTGYYEPEIKAYKNYKKGRYPLYKIDIEKYDASIFKETRSEINKGILKNKGLEIAWVENEIEAFFLHIQGSGRLRYENGEIKKIRYAGNNKKKYTSIGKILIKKGEIKKDNVNMFSVKEWLYKNKKEGRRLMEANERYIYFEEYEGEIKGSAKISLVPFISIAVDYKQYKVGDIFLIIEKNRPKKAFIGIAHDEGAAIKGRNRIDLFTGYGKEAEKKAALMKKKIFIWKLEPIEK